jgi:flavorubredoxin
MDTCQPISICRDTWLITQLEEAPPMGNLFLNSAVIAGAQPVVIDTGTPVNRTRWLQQLGTIVDPADVRWIFISHDDCDHVGNLLVLLDLCPNATVLTSWFGIGRMLFEQGIELPMPRVRFLNDGDAIDVGDRVLRAVTPPIYDNPTTRGVFDQSTGFYWGADCFAAPVPEFVTRGDDLPAEEWRDGFLTVQRMLAPWHSLLDHRRFAAQVDRVQSLPITVATGAHGPAVHGDQIADAFRLLRELPHVAPWQPFTQADLDSWLVTAATGEPAIAQANEV